MGKKRLDGKAKKQKEGRVSHRHRLWQPLAGAGQGDRVSLAPRNSFSLTIEANKNRGSAPLPPGQRKTAAVSPTVEKMLPTPLRVAFDPIMPSVCD